MLTTADAAGGGEGDLRLSCRALRRSARLQPHRLHPHHARDPLARQREEVSFAGQPRRRDPGGLFTDRRRRLCAESRAARPQEPVRYRQQRPDAASERGPCALIDRAGPAEGKREAAAKELAWHKSREIRRRFARAICDDTAGKRTTRWRCNFGRTANIATRTCRRIRRKRGSAPMSARSAPIARRTSSTTSARIAG